MKPSTVELTRSAARDLDGLEEPIRAGVLEDIASLRDTPLDRPPRVKKLRGFRAPLYRLRSGDFRILYRIDGAAVIVLRVIDLKDLERTLSRLRLGEG